jgi:hypothetical protein
MKSRTVRVAAKSRQKANGLGDDRGLRAMMAVKFVDRGPASASFT